MMYNKAFFKVAFLNHYILVPLQRHFFHFHRFYPRRERRGGASRIFRCTPAPGPQCIFVSYPPGEGRRTCRVARLDGVARACNAPPGRARARTGPAPPGTAGRGTSVESILVCSRSPPVPVDGSRRPGLRYTPRGASSLTPRRGLEPKGVPPPRR